jgi:hypothetical protein
LWIDFGILQNGMYQDCQFYLIFVWILDSVLVFR